jgi:hypothetical protein
VTLVALVARLLLSSDEQKLVYVYARAEFVFIFKCYFASKYFSAVNDLAMRALPVMKELR